MLHSSEYLQDESKWSRLFKSHEIPFKQNWPLHLMIIAFLIVWVLTAINPVDRKDWMLENGLLFAAIGVLALLYRTFKFNNISYLFITIFLIMHAIGAHYAYKTTPLDDWFKQVFHTKRGIYDRIVHFGFGLLIAYPVREIAFRIIGLRKVWLYFVIFITILASHALFEIGELCVALIADPKLAAKYLGLQGDPLDTMKDMSMNLIGAILSISLMIWFRYMKHRRRA
ncbi:MAG: DUF2238 domain-containing protein [Bacilli bacterium]